MVPRNQSGKISHGQTFYNEPRREALVKQVFNEPRITLNFSAPIVNEQGEVVRVWANFASWQRIVTEIMQAQQTSLVNMGLTTLENQVLDRHGLVLHDADPQAILHLNLAESGLKAARGIVAGDAGYTQEDHARWGKSQVNGYATSRGALGFPGYHWVC